MLVATYAGKVRSGACIQLTSERKPFRFYTMLNCRSCIAFTYWLADSIFVSVVVGYVLRACVVALKCFLHEAVVMKFVADVAHVAIVIDRKKGMRAKKLLVASA
jgi:hypothetical protein